MQKKAIIVTLFSMLLIFGACQKDDLINTSNVNSEINSGDMEITLPSSKVSLNQNGNINFGCDGLNVSNHDLPELPAKINYYYTPNNNTNYSLYHTVSTDSAHLSPTTSGQTTHDAMTVASDNCCNMCCPGYYKCVISAYSPNLQTLVATGKI